MSTPGAGPWFLNTALLSGSSDPCRDAGPRLGEKWPERPAQLGSSLSRLRSSKILSVFFLAVSLKTEAALNRHPDLGRINTMATLQSPSKLLSPFVLVRLRGAVPAVLRQPGCVHPRTCPADTANSQTRVLTDEQQGRAAEAVAVLCGRAGSAGLPPGAPCGHAGFRRGLCPLLGSPAPVLQWVCV